MAVALAFSMPAADWPQWRGPDRSNASPETNLLKQWPTNGPPLLWKAEGLGDGIASVSVAHGRLFTVGYREGREFVFGLDARSGNSLWASPVGPAIKENSLMRWLSQRTPTLDQDRLYTMTASGDLFCLNAASGREIWHKSYLNDFLSPSRVWGFCDYPLVDGDRLICVPAGPAATVVALQKKTGQLLWKTKMPDGEGAGYAATVISDAGGIRHYVAFLQHGLVGLAADDGRVLWRYNGTAARLANSYTPIVQGPFVFSANGYRGGMALLKLIREKDAIVAQELYHQQFAFSPFEDSTVLIGEHVYSFQAAGRPICIELKTGKLAWGPISTARSDFAALTYADGRLYIRRATGLMLLVQATPKEYVENGSFRIPEPEEGLGVTFPVIAGGRLYLRDNNRLFCYNVSADALKRGPVEPKTVLVSVPAVPADPAATAKPRVGKDRAPDAIFVPTPSDVVTKMLELATVKKDDVVYDLGSGDGRIVIAAAAQFGSKAVGYELDPKLVEESRRLIQQEDLAQVARIEHADLFTVDLSEATVIAVYLPSDMLRRLLPQFAKLKSGSRIVSHQFAIPGIKADRVLTLPSSEDGHQHKLYLWTTPLQATNTQGRRSTGNPN